MILGRRIVWMPLPRRAGRSAMKSPRTLAAGWCGKWSVKWGRHIWMLKLCRILRKSPEIKATHQHMTSALTVSHTAENPGSESFLRPRKPWITPNNAMAVERKGTTVWKKRLWKDQGG